MNEDNGVRWTPREAPRETPAANLTKREYFAGLAMQGLIVAYADQYSKLAIGHNIAVMARDQADALIAALEGE